MRTVRLLRLGAVLAALLAPGQARAGFETYLSPLDVVPAPTRDLLDLPNSEIAYGNYTQAAEQLGSLTTVNLGNSIGVLNPTSVGGGGLSVTLAGVKTSATSPVGAGVVTSNANTADGFNLMSTNDAFLRLTPDTSGTGASVTFSFATPVHAFGVYLMGFGTVPGSTLDMVLNGQEAPITIPRTANTNGGVQFVGFTDTGAGATQVTFNLGGFTATSRDIVGFDGISYVTVPEPPPSLLISLGGLILLGARYLGRLRRV